MSRVFTSEDRLDARTLFENIRQETVSGGYMVGVTRASYSREETDVLRLLKFFADAAGLQTDSDHAGNLWFDFPNREPGPAIVIGSHVDSVPQGGNYDGLAGVIAGLMCLRKLKQQRREKPIRVVAFRGEESAWFGIPYIGSKAFLGKLTQDDLKRPLRVNGSPSGEPLSYFMRKCGATSDVIDKGQPCGALSEIKEFWELHIEQGPVLVEMRKPFGLVTDIRGNVRHARVEIIGEEGHSGTVPRHLRRDAVMAFAEFMMRLDLAWESALDRYQDIVVTSGIVHTDSSVHAVTRIPGSIEFCLEWRSRSADVLEIFKGVVDVTRKRVEESRHVKFKFDEPITTRPASMSTELMQRAGRASTLIGPPGPAMSSGAGHDAAVFANAGVPTGMIFVRNDHGSHNPNEAMDTEDFITATEVLFNAVTSAA